MRWCEPILHGCYDHILEVGDELDHAIQVEESIADDLATCVNE
jgi:hypothetical protein